MTVSPTNKVVLWVDLYFLLCLNFTQCFTYSF
jgi:hypothetical protein